MLCKCLNNILLILALISHICIPIVIEIIVFYHEHCPFNACFYSKYFKGFLTIDKIVIVITNKLIRCIKILKLKLQYHDVKIKDIMYMAIKRSVCIYICYLNYN